MKPWQVLVTSYNAHGKIPPSVQQSSTLASWLHPPGASDIRKQSIAKRHAGRSSQTESRCSTSSATPNSSSIDLPSRRSLPETVDSLTNLSDSSLPDAFYDIYAIGLQEFKFPADGTLTLSHERITEWQRRIQECLDLLPVNYMLAQTVSLAPSLLLLVYLRVEIGPSLVSVEPAEVALGPLGWGNKGATAVRLQFATPQSKESEGPWTNIIFVNSHLVPHSRRNERRHQQVDTITSRLVFSNEKISVKTPKPQSRARKNHGIFFSPSETEDQKPLLKSPPSNSPSTILSMFEAADYLFWFGDLNFRLDRDGLSLPPPLAPLLTDDTQQLRTLKNAKSLNKTMSSFMMSLDYEHNLLPTKVTPEYIQEAVEQKRFQELLIHDQLCYALEFGQSALRYFSESFISFAPTYKFQLQQRPWKYVQPSPSKSTRAPAWCDRILYCQPYTQTDSAEDSGLVCEKYTAVESVWGSDHQPVVAVFKLCPIPRRSSAEPLQPVPSLDPLWRWKRRRDQLMQQVFRLVDFIVQIVGQHKHFLVTFMIMLSVFGFLVGLTLFLRSLPPA